MAIRFTLRGGPCDGQPVTFPTGTRPPVPIDCGGVRYMWTGGTTASPTTLPPAGTTEERLQHRQVGSAWHRLMRAMGVTMPAAINRSRRGRRRIRRAVR